MDRMAQFHIAGWIAAFATFIASANLWAKETVQPLPPGEQLPSFKLPDFRGKEWSLSECKDKKAVAIAFLGTECPLARQYGPRLQEIANKYQDKGVVVVGVFSNQQDSLAEIGAYARVLKVDLPLLKDGGNQVADRLGASRTPEVVLLDANRTIRYRGRIDDQFTYGRQKPKVEKQHLVDAIEAILAGKPIETAQTEVVGCHIGRVLKPQPNSEVTYSKHIAPILNPHCVTCHRPGEIGPFSLTNYEETVGWAAMIREVVEEERMPPWSASPKHGKFINDARLSDEQKNLIYRWVDAGAPEGDKKDLPPPPTFTEGWQIPKPDAVFHIADKPFEVPAKGEVKYQHFIVDTGFTEDKWIRAAEARPGNRAVVHHIIVGVLPPKGSTQLGDVHTEFLVATAPGAKPMILPEDMAKFVPAGSRLVFQMHYTPIGEAQPDRSSVGLVFADASKVRRQVGTNKADNHAFRIPPGASNHKVEAYHRFTRDMLLYSMFPHMHLRGKAFRYTAIYPDGNREVLLDIPRYDFNWQLSYILEEPKRMPAGTRMLCEAWYDNSEDNIANPDPTAEVRWGDQTWEEMMLGYFDVAPADVTARGGKSRTSEFVDEAKKSPPQLTDELRELARKALRSDAHFKRFGPKLREVLPQLDRVCFTTVEGDKLHVKRCNQEADLDQQVGGAGRKINVSLTKVASYAEKTEPVIHGRLANESAIDLKFMSKAYGSSAHFPVKLDGVSGTVNFWSSEPDAFPAEAIAVLQEVTALMTSK